MSCENRAWFSLAVIVILSFITTVSVSAGVPQKINYQGRLTDSVTGEPEVGTHNVIFGIYDDAASGTLLWSESQTVQTDSIGVFSAVIGSVTPIDVALIGPVWLEVEVSGEVLSPRREMVSVPFAFRAQMAERSLDADSLGGYVASDFVREGETSVITSEMIVDGTGSGLDADMLDGLNANAFADSGHVHDDRYYRQTELNSSGSINQGANPVDWTKLKNVPSGFADGIDDVGGEGDGHSLDAADGSPIDVVYVDNAGEVGIGTTSPASKLDVRGTLSVGTAGTGHDVNFYGLGSNTKVFWNQSKRSLRGGTDLGGGYWSEANTGDYSLGFGYAPTAKGSYSVAVGYYPVAGGRASVAMGQGVSADGDWSFAMGLNSDAMASNSVAIGRYADAVGANAIAIGEYVRAGGANSIVIGRGLSSGSRLVNSSSSSLVIGFDSTEPALVVDSDNNVGIGLDDPLVRLDVPGQVRIGEGDYGPGSDMGLMIIAKDNTAVSVPLVVEDKAHNLLLNVRGDGRTGIGAPIPLTRLHVRQSDIDLSTSHFQSDATVVEATDAVLGLYSSGAGFAGSAVTFGELDGGSLVDKWAMVRETSGTGGGLRITYGTNKNQLQNDAVIYFDDTGSVGINTMSPGAWRLYVAGTACGTSPWGTCSDLRFKQEIEGIENALDRILNLRGVVFRWKTEEYSDLGFPEGRHFGLIAQEAQETLPEIVRDGPDGEKSLTYTEIIPVLVESIKELKLENEALKQRIEALELAGSR